MSDCGGGFTSTREDVNGVEYVVESRRVSRNTHVCIRSYQFYVLTTCPSPFRDETMSVK